MNTTEQVLLIILATALAVFLVLAIALLIMVIRLVRSLQHISQKAEKFVTSAESVADIFRKSSGPLTILHFVRNVADVVAKHKSRKEKE